MFNPMPINPSVKAYACAGMSANLGGNALHSPLTVSAEYRGAALYLIFHTLLLLSAYLL